VAKTQIVLAETLYKKGEAGKDPEYEPGAYVNAAQGPDHSTLCYYAPVGYKIVSKSDTLVWREQAGATMSNKRDDAESNDEHVCYGLVAQSNPDGHGSGTAQIRVRVQTDKVEYMDLK